MIDVVPVVQRDRVVRTVRLVRIRLPEIVPGRYGGTTQPAPAAAIGEPGERAQFVVVGQEGDDGCGILEDEPRRPECAGHARALPGLRQLLRRVPPIRLRIHPGRARRPSNVVSDETIRVRLVTHVPRFNRFDVRPWQLCRQAVAHRVVVEQHRQPGQ